MSEAERLEKFKATTDGFFDTLHMVEVGLKRQLWALEEAGIITLSEANDAAGGADAPAATENALRPNGNGNVGNLDTGWLNSRGNHVDRVKEVEVWKRVRETLEGRQREAESSS